MKRIIVYSLALMVAGVAVDAYAYNTVEVETLRAGELRTGTITSFAGFAGGWSGSGPITVTTPLRVSGAMTIGGFPIFRSAIRARPMGDIPSGVYTNSPPSWP